MDDNVSRFEVSLRMHWYNRNLFGTHFGGSLYLMCDPFFVFILVHNLGKGYVVWDKSATIRFKKPGRGTVRAVFEITPEMLDTIREEVEVMGKKTYVFTVEIKDAEGEVVAEVDKELYVRLQKNATP